MADYTPTTEYVRDFYAKFQSSVLLDHDWEGKEAEFDRWLAQEHAKARARALERAADRMPAFHDKDAPEWAITSARKWLREQAARIRGGAR